MNVETFAGWAVAVVAIKDDRFQLRAFTVGTFHEEDAREYARQEVARDFPGWEIYTATRAIRGMKILEEAR